MSQSCWQRGVGDDREDVAGVCDAAERDGAGTHSPGVDSPASSASLADIVHLLAPTGDRLTPGGKALGAAVITTPTREYVAQYMALSAGIHRRGASSRTDGAFGHAGEPTLPHGDPPGDGLTNSERAALRRSVFGAETDEPAAGLSAPAEPGAGAAAPDAGEPSGGASDGPRTDGGLSGVDVSTHEHAGDDEGDQAEVSDSGSAAPPVPPETPRERDTSRASSARSPEPAGDGRVGSPGDQHARQRGEGAERLDPIVSFPSGRDLNTREALDAGFASGADVHRQSRALAEALLQSTEAAGAAGASSIAGDSLTEDAWLETLFVPPAGDVVDRTDPAVVDVADAAPAAGVVPHPAAPSEGGPSSGTGALGAGARELPDHGGAERAGAPPARAADHAAHRSLRDRELASARRLAEDRRAFREEWRRSGDREIQDDLGQPQTGLPRPPPQVLSEYARELGYGATDTPRGPERDAVDETPTGPSGGGVGRHGGEPGGGIPAAPSGASVPGEEGDDPRPRPDRQGPASD